MPAILESPRPPCQRPSARRHPACFISKSHIAPYGSGEACLRLAEIHTLTLTRVRRVAGPHRSDRQGPSRVVPGATERHTRSGFAGIRFEHGRSLALPYCWMICLLRVGSAELDRCLKRANQPFARDSTTKRCRHVERSETSPDEVLPPLGGSPFPRQRFPPAGGAGGDGRAYTGTLSDGEVRVEPVSPSLLLVHRRTVEDTSRAARLCPDSVRAGGFRSPTLHLAPVRKP
jgi:hypothetical protein